MRGVTATKDPQLFPLEGHLEAVTGLDKHSATLK